MNKEEKLATVFVAMLFAAAQRGNENTGVLDLDLAFMDAEDFFRAADRRGISIKDLFNE